MRQIVQPRQSVREWLMQAGGRLWSEERGGFVGGGGAASFVGARVYRTTNGSQASGDAIPFETVDYDTSGFWSAGQPTRLTVPAGLGGRYIFGANTDVAGAPPPAGSYEINLRSSTKADPTIVAVEGSTTIFANPLLAVCSMRTLAAGEFLTAVVFSPGVWIPSGNELTAFWLCRLG